MGFYYKFFRPDNFKLIDEDKFAGMPFYYSDLPIQLKMIPCCKDKYNPLNECYDMTGLLSRDDAIQLQKIMTSNKTIFTDMMNKEHIDALLFRIE